MEAPARRPNILHLGGITLADFVPIEDVFDAKVLEVARADARPPGPLPRDAIPAVFTRVEDWPRSTNLRCWSCVFTFDGPPAFIPTSVRERGDGTSGLRIGVEGNFCTFNCAARRIDDMYPPQAFPDKHWRMRDNLCLVYTLFTGRVVAHIEPAPRMTERREWGGELDAEEFWERLRALDPQHGLRDHRVGSVIPERLRTPIAGRALWSVRSQDGDAASRGAKAASRGAEAEPLQPGAAGLADSDFDLLLADLCGPES